MTLVWTGGASKGFASVGEGMEGGWIGHGIAMLSACAKAAGFAVDLIDRRALRGWDEFRSEVARRRPDVIGFTMLSVDYDDVMREVELAKDAHPNAITIVGGPHPTIAPDEVAANSKIDHILMGEGEISFVEFLRQVERGETPPRVIQGQRPDLDALPFADRDLYLQEWAQRGYVVVSPEAPLCPELPPPFVTIIAGRGCLYNCSFCKPAEDLLFGKKVRRRSVGHVVHELKVLRDKYHFNSMMIHDDCLTEDREWVREFCDAYRSGGFTQPFFCQARVDNVVQHEDMIRLMAGVGLRGLFLGFESGSDRVLRFIRKGTTRAINLEAARVCRKYGISIWANYMLGLPTETPEEVRETVSMLKEIDPDYYSPAFYTPYPGNDLYSYCEEHHLSLIERHEQLNRNPNSMKIRGHDPQVLFWALEESQRRTLPNRVKRGASHYWRRYASPRKIVRKARQLMGI
ncbi:MAG: B12-binding domain-containing radical SAM protein [Chloroflexi bacterium]|nr:B12-binding domain-containing radical SAM protein [Chloroflexota bacterium]